MLTGIMAFKLKRLKHNLCFTSGKFSKIRLITNLVNNINQTKQRILLKKAKGLKERKKKID
jgi:hypothetical protein